MNLLRPSKKMYEALKLLEPCAAFAGKHSDDFAKLAREAIAEYEQFMREESEEWFIDDKWKLRESSRHEMEMMVPGIINTYGDLR